MKLVYFIGGLMTVVIAFQFNPKAGGLLTVIYILSLLYVAQQKGVITQ